MRYRYPERFNTKREMLWYIKGLMDSKRFYNMTIDNEIQRYRTSVSFTEFKGDNNDTKD